MFRRAAFTMVGLGAGVVLGMWTIRKLEETQRKLAPDQLAGAAAARVGAARARWAVAVAEGRAAAAAKEAELRAVYRGGESPPDLPANGARGPAPLLDPD